LGGRQGWILGKPISSEFLGDFGAVNSLNQEAREHSQGIRKSHHRRRLSSFVVSKPLVRDDADSSNLEGARHANEGLPCNNPPILAI